MKVDLTSNASGLPGALGMGLLFFAVSFYFSALAPALAEQARLQAEEQKLKLPVRQPIEPAAAAGGETPAALGKLPPSAEAMELFDRLHAAGERNGIAIERATYNVVRHEENGSLQYEVTLPLRGAYPNLRTFLRESLELAPTASLDSLTLQRAKASDPGLDASVRLSYFFALK